MIPPEAMMAHRGDLTWRGDAGAGAVFSKDGLYRYVLWRGLTACGLTTADDRRYCLFIMLNPSTADECTEDATIRRCRSFAAAWNYDVLVVCNLYGFRATDPRHLRTAADPIGPRNDELLEIFTRSVERVICAWGTHGVARGLKLTSRLRAWALRDLHTLGLTLSGAPRHPLYVRSATTPKVLP